MKKKKAYNRELDLNDVVSKKIRQYTVGIMCESINQYLQDKGLIYDNDKVTVDYEYVPNYSIKIFTARYDGVIMMMRKMNDMNGLKFKFEAYCFGDRFE